MQKLTLNGINIAYQLSGNLQSDETIVLLNGGLASFSSWDLNRPSLEKLGLKILLHDFRGQALSDKPEGPYSFQVHANDLKALLEHLNINQAHLVGICYGGTVGQQFAISYPQKVKSLTLLSTSSETDELIAHKNEIRFSLLDDILSAPTNEESTRLKKLLYQNEISTLFCETFMRKHQEMLTQRQAVFATLPQDFFRALSQIYQTAATSNLSPQLHKITCPVLIVCGEKDQSTPLKFSTILKTNIPHAEFMVLPETGHVITFEKPKEVESLVAGFILKNS